MYHGVIPLRSPIVAPPHDAIEDALVEGDRLQVAGDPRGELVVTQARLAREPDNEQLQQLEHELLARHGDVWLAGLADHPALDFEWQLGEIDRIRIDEERAGGENIRELLGRALAVPVATRVRAIHSVMDDRGVDAWDIQADFEGIVQALGEAPQRASIRELVCDYPWPGAVDLGAMGTELGNLDAVWNALPALEHAAFVAYSMELGTLPTERLKFLALITPYGLRDPGYQRVTGAAWPVLETLIIHRCNASVTAMQLLLDARAVPALRHLVLRQLPADVLERVPGSAVVKQLETLELGWLNTGGRRPRFSRDDPAFVHLRRFDYR